MTPAHATNQTAPETAAVPPAIQVSGLSKTFSSGGLWRRRPVQALRDITMDIHRGEIISLVGESGSGKSTLARCLARLETPDSGHIRSEGQDVLRTEPRRASRAYRRKVQMVFQDPFGSLNPTQRVEHVLSRTLQLHGRNGSVRSTALRELLDSVGLESGVLSAFPHELSGGQRQRVAIARVLAVEPEVILADEPTSMLDVSVRIGILNLLAKLRDERGIAIVYVTHDLSSARYLSDRTIVMNHGRMVEGGDTEVLLSSPAHPYTRLLLSAVPDPTRRGTFDREERLELRRQIAEWTASDDMSVHPAGDDPQNHWILRPTAGLPTPPS